MSDSIWGPLTPPKWLSNYETSLLNAQEGRARAASFNEAWNASFGRSQQAGIQSARDEHMAGLEAAREKRQNEMKLSNQEQERKRIAGEDALRQSSITDSIARRMQKEFQEKLGGFIKSLDPTNQPPDYSSYGSPGGPGNNLAPWLNEPIKRFNPEPEGPNQSIFGNNLFGEQASPITGESGPFDPTYEDYQRAKAEHPALWLDPVTAPTMQKMDQSWNEMEKIRMMAEKNKDAHQAFQAKQAADQMALDVGKQGGSRFGFREDAYHKAPSEIQMKIDAMTNGGRYPEDDPISKQLRFRPLTSAAEQILNQYLSDNGQLRIDGANAEEIRQRKIEARRAANKGGTEKYSIGPKGETITLTPASEIKSESPLGKGMSDRDRRLAAGTLTPEDAKRFDEYLDKVKSPSAGHKQAYLELIDAEKEARTGGNLDLADRIKNRLDRLDGSESESELKKIHDSIDRDDIKTLEKLLLKTTYAKPGPKRDSVLAQKEAILQRITDRHTPKPRPSAPASAPPGWKMTPGGEWMRPDNSQSQNVPEPDTNAAPATVPTATNAPTETNAAPKLPKAVTPADKAKAIRLANEAYERAGGTNSPPGTLEKIKKKLAEVGVEVK